METKTKSYLMISLSFKEQILCNKEVKAMALAWKLVFFRGVGIATLFLCKCHTVNQATFLQASINAVKLYLHFEPKGS